MALPSNIFVRSATEKNRPLKRCSIQSAYPASMSTRFTRDMAGLIERDRGVMIGLRCNRLDRLNAGVYRTLGLRQTNLNASPDYQKGESLHLLQ